MIRRRPRGAFAAAVAAACAVAPVCVLMPSLASAQATITATVTVLPPGELLALSAIRQGNVDVHPGGPETPVLVFRIDNHFNSSKTITGVRLRDASRGVGTQAQRLTNVESVALYLDLDGDFWVSPGDSLLAGAPFTSSSVALAFDSVTLPTDSGVTFIATIKASLFPRDRDSLDLFFYRATDLITADGTVPVGADSVNSFGYNITDGMSAAQIAFVATGDTVISPADGMVPALLVDIPRNGYMPDTLQIFNAVHLGSAPRSSIDSLVLLVDDGNGNWGGAGEEIRLGRLTFTGGLWSLSGLARELTLPTTRFYLGVCLAAFPANLATVHFGIPQNGLQMRSGNDGPLDLAVRAPDTLVIRSQEALQVVAVPVPLRTLIPGLPTPPLWALGVHNSHAFDIGADSLRLRLVASDPQGATQAELDSQFDSLLLYLDLDGNPGVIGTADILLDRASLNSGAAVFRTAGLSVAQSGGELNLALAAYPSATHAKNANLINFALAGAGDLFTSPSTTAGGAFPIQNAGDHRIDAFPANRVALTPIAAATLFGGETDRPLLRFRLPANGYATDTLVSLRVTDNGSFTEAPLYVTVKLWHDLAADGLTSDDVPLGTLNYSGTAWQTSGLGIPVPASGLPLIVTADVANAPFDGGTLQLGIPVRGVGYLSGTDGPDDAALFNTATHLVLPPSRITAIPIASPSEVVSPGSSGHVLLAFALYNGYLNQTKTLGGLWFTNSSRTRSTPAWADSELGQVSLVLDKDGDRQYNGDSLLGTGTFAGGSLHISGLNVSLAPESLAYLYVVTDLPLAVIDGDSLDLNISSITDFEFTGAAVMNGDLPLTNGGYLVVDGSVGAQYSLPALPARSLKPGDSDVTLFAIRPAINGDLVDTLRSLTVTNLADADAADLASLRLWLDRNGDGLWQDTDSLLGAFANFGSDWVIAALHLELSAPSPTLLVTGRVSLLATPGRSFEAAIPVNGCQYTSGNDGPRDAALGGGTAFTVSTSGLRIAGTPLLTSYTVGQNIALRATVTNLTSVSMDSVVGTIQYADNPALVSLDSGQVGPVSLGPGASTDLVWYYRAVSPGTTFWRLRAEAPGIPDSSAVIQSGTASIQSACGPLIVRLINSTPTAVSRGQLNVFPLSLSYAHPDTSEQTAAVRLDSLLLGVETAAGAPLPAGSAFSRIALFAGSSPVAVVTAVPLQSSVWLKFTSPVIVEPGQSVTYSLLVDIAAAASANDFVLSVASAASVPLTDANNGQALALSPSVNFPLKTASCSVVDPSRFMAVSYQPMLAAAVNYGQAHAAAIRLLVRHPGLPGSSQIQLSSLRLAVQDGSGGGVPASSLFTDVYLTQGAGIIGRWSSGQSGTSVIDIPFYLPVTLSPGQVDSLTVEVSVKDAATEPGFQIAIADSSHFTVRDLSSGMPLEAGTDTVLSTSAVFPIRSGWASLQQPADAPLICVTSALPTGILSGVDLLPLLHMELVQPDGVNASGTRVTSIQVMARDSLGNILDPNSLFDRVGIRIGTGPVWYQSFIDVMTGAAVFKLGDSSLLLLPGDTVGLDLVGDVEADVPYNHFALRVVAESAFEVSDAIDTTRNPGLAVQVGCAGFPFQTAYTQIFLPAGRPVFAPQTRPLQVAFPGRSGLEMFSSALSYQSTLPQADLAVRSLQGDLSRRTSDGVAAASASALFSAVRLLANGVVVATDTILTGGRILLSLPVDYGVVNGATVDLAVQVDIRSDAPLGNYVLNFADSTFLDVRETNEFLRVFPLLAAGSYPVWSTEISLSEASLENSFSNYPNPFVPSRGEVTTLAYVLEEDANIDVDLYTTTGSAVARLASGEFRALGAYNDLTWDGQNGSGHNVAPGVYLCRFVAHYLSGRTVTVTRRVAVVR